MEEAEPRARINYKALRKYLNKGVRQLGSKRRIAEAAGVSHTMIQQLYSGLSSSGKTRRLTSTSKPLGRSRKRLAHRRGFFLYPKR